MPAPILCYVTDRKSLADARNEGDRIHSLLERIQQALKSGVDWIQIREKDLEGQDLLQLAAAAVRFQSTAGRQARSRILINDRLDVALAAGADGVHLGDNSIPLRTISAWRRESGRADFRIGSSCHSMEQARLAEAEGADYVFFGPIFSTPSKERFGPPQGLQQLAEVCRSVSIPVVAIGGVNTENAFSCYQAGARGIAAIRIFQDSPDLAVLTAKLR